MGYNSTVVVLNDALGDIQDDPEFGQSLARAIVSVVRGQPVHVRAGSHSNAATVIETHHADGIVPVLIGANTGTIIGDIYIGWRTEDAELELLRQLAKKHGFRLSRLPNLNVKAAR